MALTPILSGVTVSIGETAVEETTEERQTSATYKVDFANGRISGRITDDIEAVRQAIHKILMTERFAYLIYSWNYGFELNTVLGQGESVLRSEIGRLLTEALTADDRIDAVENLSINIIDKRTAAVDFTAVTVYGEIPVSERVNY
ncbi:phage protein [Eubacteriales bacterium]|nr:DUF2634 domain-containing protein [Oscillospiraceae bacterium]MBS1380695.1 DUF2634 domain-containing protein [Oscillospiraceae bacterium]GKH49062.1 phage protein [Eubacteriales bacterium]GKH61703.1 phage protein [Eubacteriales bacterium]